MENERRYSVSLELGFPAEGTEPLEVIHAIADTLKARNIRLIMMQVEEVKDRVITKTFPPNISDSENKLDELKKLLADPTITDAPIYNTRQVVGFFPGLRNDNLYYWERRGKIHPVKTRSGSKLYKRYPLVEVVRTGLIWNYDQNGVPLDSAAQQANREIQSMLESKNK